jgi:ubiquitin carboxyl-terminal hydrolase MINDY-1/2
MYFLLTPVGLLAEYLVSQAPEPNSGSETVLSFQQTLDEVLAILPSLQHGMDVNVHFADPKKFELTPALCIFDILDIELVHGWVCDPQDSETYDVVAKQLVSYNKVTDAVVRGKDSIAGADADKNMIVGIICSQFLEESVSQLTYVGLNRLYKALAPAKPAVFFRNNHFSTIIKTHDKLWTLATDEGYLDENEMVWESIHLHGNSTFTNSWFGDEQNRQETTNSE